MPLKLCVNETATKMFSKILNETNMFRHTCMTTRNSDEKYIDYALIKNQFDTIQIDIILGSPKGFKGVSHVQNLPPEWM